MVCEVLIVIISEPAREWIREEGLVCVRVGTETRTRTGRSLETASNSRGGRGPGKNARH